MMVVRINVTWKAFGAALAVAMTLRLAAMAQERVPQKSVAMSVGQQNELVARRCAICHNDAMRKGGLSLEHFDLAHADPDVAHMMVVKMADDGAITAAGAPVPDEATVDALFGALSAAGRRTPPVPNGWTVDLTVDPLRPGAGHSFVTARAVQDVPLTSNARGTAVYQLTLTCNGAVRRANTQLLTTTKAGPDAPTVARAAPAMTLAWPLSGDTLKVSGLFPGESVSFPIGALSPTIRDLFSWCFASPDAGAETR